MAWNIAGVSRRTRDAAVEAARRAGMGLDDWLDDAIADHAGLDLRAPPEQDYAPDDRLDAAAGRLERIARRNTPVKEARAAGMPGAFDSVIERFEVRLARAQAQAARAFELVAQILERDDAARDGDRRALIDAVRRLESIRASLTGAAQYRRDARRWFRSSPRAGPEGAIRSQGRGVANRHAPPRGSRPAPAGPAPPLRTRQQPPSTTARPRWPGAGPIQASWTPVRKRKPARAPRLAPSKRRRGAAHAIVAR